jgi:Uma2 family endonuclease
MTSQAERVTISAGGATMVAVTTFDDDFHRITVDEFEAAIGLGLFQRTELIEGVVYEMASQYSVHGAAGAVVFKALLPCFPDDWVWFGVTVTVGPHSAVDPDVLVVDGHAPIDGDRFVPAKFVKLAVEVSVSTRREDLGPKLRLYASAGVPQYWVVDPRPGVGELIRHAEPVGDTYTDVRRYAVGAGAEQLDAGTVLAGG